MTKMLPPKSLRCETEYRRSFKKSRFTCSATTYQHNLDFRTEQKRRFVEHNPEPFAWDPEDIESDSGSDWSCEEPGRSNRLTHTQYKHEKLNRLYEKRMNGKQVGNRNGEVQGNRNGEVQGNRNGEVQGNRNGEVQGNRNGEVQTLSTREKSRQESEDEREETEEEEDGESGSESDASVVHIIEPEFVREPARRTVSSRPVANKQTQTDRDTKHQLNKKSSPAPFLPYGYEADVKEIGNKLTHNVRAARQVYPSALRAQKNRKTTDQQIHNRGKHGQASDRLRLTSSEPVRIFVHSDDFDDPDWVTEYDRNYQRYDLNEYRKRPDSARIRARELLPQLSGKARRQTRS